jgi:hypothetical protein
MKGGRSPTKSVGGQQELIGHWQDIARSLTNFLNTLKANNVSNHVINSDTLHFTEMFTRIEIFIICRCLPFWLERCLFRYSHSSTFSCLTGECFFLFS